jgi:hypothetical protein
VGGQQDLADGTLARLSSTTYRLAWNTGESVAVAVTSQGGWLDWPVGLGPLHGPGSVQGLLGSDSRQATDFQLPNGSVLQPPLSTGQILGSFAEAWRVAPGAALFDDRPAAAAPGSSFSPALLLQYMSAMGDAAGAAAHDLRRDAPGCGLPDRRTPLRRRRQLTLSRLTTALIPSCRPEREARSGETFCPR